MRVPAPPFPLNILAGMIAALVIGTAIFALAGCASVVERLKCGEDGAVDWDANTVEAPPHCNGPSWGRRAASQEQPR